MLRSIKDIIGYGIRAKDGKIGTVKDFYFDDDSWTIRYVVADTGGWLLGRQVLISPASVDAPDWSSRLVLVNLTKEKIENSPPILSDKPVSRQEEERIVKYYEWPYYWGPVAAIGFGNAIPVQQQPIDSEDTEISKSAEGYLRSSVEVMGYRAQASDNEVGHIEDLLASTNNWVIRLLVLDTKNWLPGKKVVVLPNLIKRIEWETQKVYVNLSEDQIRNSPEFDPEKPINPQQEVVFYDYYGRPAK